MLHISGSRVGETRRASRIVVARAAAASDGNPMPFFLSALLAVTAGGTGRPYREELRSLAH